MRNNNTVQVTRWRWNQLIISKYGWKGQLCCRRSDVWTRAFFKGSQSPAILHFSGWKSRLARWKKRQIWPDDEMLEMRMELNQCCQGSIFQILLLGGQNHCCFEKFLWWKIQFMLSVTHSYPAVQCGSLFGWRPASVASSNSSAAWEQGWKMSNYSVQITQTKFYS